MNLLTLCKTVGDVLYEKGIIGHMTIDLVSFPNPSDPKAHPLFWAIDINNELSDLAAITMFFDILMEGQQDQDTGAYEIEVIKDMEDARHDTGPSSMNNVIKEPRCFMYCSFLHHQGLSTI